MLTLILKYLGIQMTYTNIGNEMVKLKSRLIINISVHIFGHWPHMVPYTSGVVHSSCKCYSLKSMHVLYTPQCLQMVCDGQMFHTLTFADRLSCYILYRCQGSKSCDPSSGHSWSSMCNQTSGITLRKVYLARLLTAYTCGVFSAYA